MKRNPANKKNRMTERDNRSNTPRVLVLLATYNGLPWLDEQIESLLKQADVDLEILASDDGSTDGTRDALDRFAKVDPRLTVLPDVTPRGSAAANFRRLIADADSRSFTHVAFSDQDDVWPPDKVVTGCRMLTAQGADLYSAAVSAWWSDDKKVDLAQSSEQRLADFMFEGAGQGCTFVMSKALFDDVRAFVVAHREEVACLHYHDWLIYALTRSLGRRWVWNATPCMLYRQHSRNDTGAQSSSDGIRRRLQLIRSGWYRKQVASMITVCRIANPQSEAARRAEALMAAANRSWFQRLRWSGFIFAHGRRRMRDRMITFVASLNGYL